MAFQDANQENNLDRSINKNPWPYISQFFEYTDAASSTGQQCVNNHRFKCVLCEPAIKFVSANSKSLSNLKTHVRSKHSVKAKHFETICESRGRCELRVKNISKKRPIELDLCDGDSPHANRKHQPTVSEIIASSSTRVNQTKLNKLVTDFVIGEMLPFKIVESLTFKKLILTLAPSKDVIGRKALVSEISKQYDSVVEALKLKIADSKWVATTADCWSCRNK